MHQQLYSMKRGIWTVVLLMMAAGARGQVKLHPDTLQCHIIGFSAGLMAPVGGTSSGGVSGGNMSDLYSAPFLDFALECDYKYKSNWMVTLDADLWFGINSNNLKHRQERMSDVFTTSGYAMSSGGYDGAMTFYNRGIAARLGMGRILTVLPRNPNSGILLKVSGGWFVQQTVFVQDFNEAPVPQLSGDYAKLYDHLRNGAILTESVGFSYISNTFTYVNFKVTFDISQCWSWSSRPYVIDNYIGLNGKDKNRYFDLLLGVKLTWMFPLTGKTTYDYYYY